MRDTLPTPPQPSAIVFDWDNTLVDSWRCIWLAMNRTLSAMGHAEWTLAETKVRAALSLRNSFPSLFGKRWTEARDVFYENFSAIHLSHLVPLPGAPEMLDTFRALGLPLAILSNKNGDFLRQEIDHLGWQSYFGKVVGATDAPEDKPSVVPVHLIAEALGVSLDGGVWFVGDAAVDIECGAKAGCTTVLLRPEPPTEPIFQRVVPRCYLPCCPDFTDLVRELLVPISGI